MLPERCSECIFAKELPRPQVDGVVDLSKPPAIMCRRYPPQFITGMTPEGKQTWVPSWPQITGDAWCGEFVRAGETERQESLLEGQRKCDECRIPDTSGYCVVCGVVMRDSPI